MTTCVDCGTRFDPAIFGNTPATCPHCGREWTSDAADQWNDAARVTSLAEAGYLVNLLGSIGVSARIFDARSFNAIHGTWEQAYVIQVPSDQIRDAVGLLQHESDAAADEEGDELPARRFDASDDSLIFWRPVALMAIAGVASFVVGQRFAVSSDGQMRPYAESLVAAMEHAGAPLVTEQRGDGVRHRFVFHPQRRSWTVQSDRDGDGRFDTLHEFSGSAVMER